ncbi:MAG: hypothetical protein HKM06_09650 [Spirochaetales bacterium]|nr:hypothetical protein [Spirochaetales bacterium]
MKRFWLGLLILAITQVPLEAQHVYTLLQDATRKAREICAGQPPPVMDPDAQEKIWLNAEAQRRWGVDWDALKAEGPKGLLRETFLYQCLASVELSTRNPPPVADPKSALSKENRRLAALSSPQELPFPGSF